MTSQSSAAPEGMGESTAIPSAAMGATRPFYWSVRRELWETRSIYIAPIATAAVVLLASMVAAAVLFQFGSLHDAVNLRHGLSVLAALDQAQQAADLSKPLGAVAFPITAAGFLVAVFYCLGALHNERRDRSILFWKSLPVSDLVTVLSKASIPLVVLPVLLFVTIVVSRLLLLLLGTVVVMANGLSPATLWTNVPLLQFSLVPLYGVAVQALWYAPIYGWLLLVSGWARRAPFLWAVLPPLALCLFEKIAFHTGYLFSLLGYRLAGSDAAAFRRARPAMTSSSTNCGNSIRRSF